MSASALSTKPLLDSLAGYPHWFVAICLTLVCAAAIWVVVKVLKWSLYVLIALVLIAGIGATIWLLWH